MTTYYSLSPRQIQDWHINYTIKKGQSPNVLTFDIRLPGNTDLACFHKAYADLIKKHAILRTSFPLIDGEIKLQVHDYDPDRFSLSCEGCLEGKETVINVYKYALPKFRNIRHGPLIRAILLKDQDNGYLFIFLIHHIICDYRSLSILKGEMETLYYRARMGEQIQIPCDHSHWMDYLERNKTKVDLTQAKTLQYWRNELLDMKWRINYDTLYNKVPNVLLPVAHSKKRRGWSDLYQSDLLKKPKGESYIVFAGDDLLEKLHKFKTASKFSVFTILLTGLTILAAKLTENNCILTQITYSDRNRAETNNLIGNLLGTLLLYIDIDVDNTFRELAKKVYTSFFISIDNMLYNTESLESLKLTPNSFLFFNFISKEVSGGGKVSITPPAAGKKVDAKCPLYCMATEFDNTIKFHWEYHLSFFNRQIIAFLTDSCFSLLQTLMDAPDKPIKFAL
ncbi:MAG TPA: condensation domain-containing protein [Puia sp.]|nr:condensation domain-containing protein [Puia sp.]